MLGPEQARARGQYPAVEGLRAGEVVAGVEQDGEVVQADERVGMLGAEGAFLRGTGEGEEG